MRVDPQKLFFYDPRMEMTVAGRLTTRAVGIVSMITLMAIAVVFLLSQDNVPDLRFAGVLLALILIDYGMRYNHAHRDLDVHVWRALKKGDRINIADYTTPRAFRTAIGAADGAWITKKNFYLNLLARLVDIPEVKEGLWRLNVSPDEFKKKVRDQLQKSAEEPSRTKVELLLLVESFMRFAFAEAVRARNEYIDPHHLFGALFHVSSDDIANIFSFFDIDKKDLAHSLIFGIHRRKFSRLRILFDGSRRVKTRVMNRAWTARPTKTLDQYSVDLTSLATYGRGALLLGHEEEFERLTDVLARPQKGDALLVGEPGSGKGAVVMHLAYRIFRDRVPSPLFDKRLVELSVGNLAAGAEPSVLQARIKKIVEEILLAGNIILFIPDLHNIMRTSGKEALNAGDILLPYITQGSLQIIGATTQRDFKHYIEPNADFASALEPVYVKEIDEENAAQYLIYAALQLERLYKIKTSYKAVKKSVELAKKYLRERLLPSSAEDLLKETFASAKDQHTTHVQEEDVIAIVERKTQVPIHKTSREEARRLLSLEEEIHRQYIDQEGAVAAVSRALREYRSGLARGTGPIATFLFVGPTGVGKTELSKILAQLQFGSEKSMLRFDMSEFQEKQTIERLIGSPDGEVTGQLTEAVRLKPYGLVLLDEFEKAHPDLLNLFLQVFDDGRLTDGTGNVVDFSNTIIIATSNAHSEFIQAEIGRGKTMPEIIEDLKRMLVSYFRPELLNRFSEIVMFQTLKLEHIERIARLQLGQLALILDETHGIKFVADEEAVKAISLMGYDPMFGARPLRKVISEKLKSKLANAILQGDIDRGERIRLSYQNSDFVFLKSTEQK